MPDRDLPEELKARLSNELSAGAPLRAPLASQARYATVPTAGVPRRRLSGRRVTLAAAALVVLLAAGFAGPPQPRAWLVRTVGNIAGDLGGQATSSSPSPLNPSPAGSSPLGATDDRSPSPKAAETPDGDETPGARQSPEPQESPQPTQSPAPQESPQPTQSPDGGGSSGGGGDQTNPTPSPSPDGSGDGH